MHDGKGKGGFQILSTIVKGAFPVILPKLQTSGE